MGSGKYREKVKKRKLVLVTWDGFELHLRVLP